MEFSAKVFIRYKTPIIVWGGNFYNINLSIYSCLYWNIIHNCYWNSIIDIKFNEIQFILFLIRSYHNYVLIIKKLEFKLGHKIYTCIRMVGYFNNKIDTEAGNCKLSGKNIFKIKAKSNLRFIRICSIFIELKIKFRRKRWSNGLRWKCTEIYVFNPWFVNINQL